MDLFKKSLLTRLDLSDCPLVFPVKPLGELSSLTALNLSGCKTREENDLQEISQLPLQQLNLNFCSLQDASLKHVPPSVTELDLRNNPISDECLPQLRMLALRVLDLGRTNIQLGQGVENFLPITLKELRLSWCNISDKSMNILAWLPLIKLDISYCYGITDEGIENLTDSWGAKRTITDLDVSCCNQITSHALQALSQIPLQTLSLRGCDEVDDEGLQYLSGLPLKDLSLHGCDKITDDGLQYLSGLPLKNLSLYGCDKITDEGLQKLSPLHLKSLSLHNCDKITDDGLPHIDRTSLEELDIGGCDEITDKGLQFVVSGSMKQLNISMCGGMTDDSADLLATIPPQNLNLMLSSVSEESVKSARKKRKELS